MNKAKESFWDQVFWTLAVVGVFFFFGPAAVVEFALVFALAIVEMSLSMLTWGLPFVGLCYFGAAYGETFHKK